MAELTKITVAQISDYDGGGGGSTTVDTTKAYRVKNYASLATLIPNAEGDIAVVALRLTNNTSRASRRGGGIFMAVAGTATADGGLIVQSTGFYWQRVGNDVITPQMFGASVDGSTDDTSAFAAALSAAVGRSMPLTMPAGTYTINGQTTIGTAGTRIVGEGPSQTIMNVGATYNAFIVSPGINNFELVGVGVYSVGGTKAQTGVYANGGSLSTGSIGYMLLEECEFVGFNYGCLLQYCQLGLIHKCTFLNNNYGYYQKLSVNQRVLNNKMILNNVGVYLNGDSTAVTQSAGTLMSGNEIVNGGASGGSSVLIQYNEHFVLTNNMIDAPSTSANNAVHCIGVSRGTISDNWIGAHPQMGVRLENCTDVKVHGNDILSHGTNGVATVGTTTGCLITGNNLNANTGYDLLAGGSSYQNMFSNNFCRSSTAAYSYAETASGMGNIVTGNFFNQPTTYDTVNTVFANNKTV